MLQRGPSTFDVQVDGLPDLPSASKADRLIEVVYLYTQARYCIVDWVRLRQWHQQREKICFSFRDGESETQIGTIQILNLLRTLRYDLQPSRSLFHLDYLRYWRSLRVQL